MNFSVIVCTHNRAANLPDCVSRLEEQDVPDNIRWEILFVDNNSSDGTKDVVTNLARQCRIPIRYCFEPALGLNNARNRGIQESSAPLYAFIDDDILVSHRWLAAILSAFQRTDADAVGGRIHIDPEISLPSWISKNEEMLGFIGYHDLGPGPFEMNTKTGMPFGGNMAFNRRVVRKIGLFDPRLGRKGEGRRRVELYKGSETEYFHRLVKAGGQICYQPDAIVYHRVKPFQIRKSYFRTVHFNAGFQKAFFDSGEYMRTVLGIPLFLIPQLFRSARKYCRQVFTRGPDFAFRQQMTVGYFLGMIVGYMRRSRVIREDVKPT